MRIGWGNETADMRLSASRRATTGYTSVYDDSHRSQLQFRGDFRVSPADDVSVKVGVATEAFGEGVPRVSCDTLLGLGTCDSNKERTDFWRNGGKALRQNLEIQRTDIWTPSLRTMVGAEVLREEVRSPSLFSTDASISARQFRLFGGIEWKPAKDWVVNTGGMWEKHSMAGSTFAPRLAVNHHVSPEHTLRWITTQSFRMPSIYMFRGLANLQVSVTPPLLPTMSSPYAAATGNVKPESVIANEIGYLGEMRRFGLKLDVRAFTERINQRQWSRSLDMVNFPGPEIHGFEYQFDWRPFDATRIVFAEAQLREEAGRNDVNNLEHFEAPHRTGSVALYQKLPAGFDLSLITYYATPYQWAGMQQVLDSVRQLDARLAYAFRVGATRGELAVMVQSLGGSHMEYLRTQMFGRRAFATLRLDF